MAKSGISVSDQCVTDFGLLKTKHKLRWIIYKVSDDNKSFDVEKTQEHSEDDKWEDFCDQLPDDGSRTGIYDLPVRTKDGANSEKLVIINWTGPKANVKKRMIHTTSVSALLTKLSVEGATQFDDRADLANIEEHMREDRFKSCVRCTYNGH